MHFTKIGQGKPILFLHGWGCDGNIFLPTAKLLPNNECYLVDFAGFGKSEKPSPQGWSVYDFSQDVIGFLRQQGLKNITIVAHSFGCRVAIVLSALYPQYVKNMLLFAPAGLRKFSLKRLCKITAYKLRKFFCRMGQSQNLSERYGSVDYNACEDAMKNTFVKVVNEDLSKYAKLVDCPTLIVNGVDDVDTPLSHAKRLRNLIADSSLVEIDGDHFALLLNPHIFAEIIRLFENEDDGV